FCPSHYLPLWHGMEMDMDSYFVFPFFPYPISIKKGFAPLISCLYAIEWRWLWTHILFSLHFHIQFQFKKVLPLSLVVSMALNGDGYGLMFYFPSIFDIQFEFKK
ncbi:hypothetical protein S245_060979, partial [Arachis hypogaea]